MAWGTLHEYSRVNEALEFFITRRVGWDSKAAHRTAAAEEPEQSTAAVAPILCAGRYVFRRP